MSIIYNFGKIPQIQIYTILSCFTHYQTINLKLKSPLYLIRVYDFFLSVKIRFSKLSHRKTRGKMTLESSIKLAKAAVNIFMVRSVLCTIYMQLAGLIERIYAAVLLLHCKQSVWQKGKHTDHRATARLASCFLNRLP